MNISCCCSSNWCCKTLERNKLFIMYAATGVVYIINATSSVYIYGHEYKIHFIQEYKIKQIRIVLALQDKSINTTSLIRIVIELLQKLTRTIRRYKSMTEQSTSVQNTICCIKGLRIDGEDCKDLSAETYKSVEVMYIIFVSCT